MAGQGQNGNAGKPAMRAVVALAITAVLVVLFYVYVSLDYFEWVLVAHVVSVISWIAGMLYLPRLFVYHAQSTVGSEQSETFKVMERRLLRGIMNPAMIASWVFGLWMAWKAFHFNGTWLHAKIALVLIMSAAHGYFSVAVRRFAEDRNEKPARHWRIVNEVPTLLMIGIVILVIIQPSFY